MDFFMSIPEKDTKKEIDPPISRIIPAKGKEQSFFCTANAAKKRTHETILNTSKKDHFVFFVFSVDFIYKMFWFCLKRQVLSPQTKTKHPSMNLYISISLSDLFVNSHIPFCLLYNYGIL